MSTAILPRPVLRRSVDSPSQIASVTPSDPASTDEVGLALLAYLAVHWSADSLGYDVPLSPIVNGWETYAYRFRLRAHASLPRRWQVPLILRIYSSPEGSGRAGREFAAQAYLQRLRYPVAAPLLLENSPQVFGGPFMIMQEASGELLPDYLYHRPWRIWDLPAKMADCHARLHWLPIEGFLSSPGSFLDRTLEELRLLIRTHGLRGLVPGYAWLASHRPASSHPPSIIHLDYHPLNLICDGDSLTVLDWTEVDVGDPHADVATTRMLMDCVPLVRPTPRERTTYWIGRGMLRRRYLRAYRRRLPLHRATLAYYQAWAALRRLCYYGRWLDAGPSSTGGKPSSIRHLTQDLLDKLCDYFKKWSGARVHLEVKGQAHRR